MEKLQFIEDQEAGIEVVSMERVRISYPLHTHSAHYAFGIVTEGKILIRIADKDYECSEGEYFFVLPDVKHSIEPVTDYYSMVGFCDQSHLDRVFKKQVGISPEQFVNSAILSNAKP